MPELTLNGCAPIPLAHYLKALGILRVVAEQKDSEVKAFWRDERFVLQTELTKDGLVSFFSREYRPSPILAPWNGGSGFFPKDNDEALCSIEQSNIDRLRAYRETIAAARQQLKAQKLEAKPEDKAVKAEFIQACRNCFPDAAIDWLDAVVVIGADGTEYPPLLGTGGNDGRLEFTNNFMQRLTEVINFESEEAAPDSGSWLEASLFGKPAAGALMKAPVGQFFPSAAGGANSTSGFDGISAVNPWDFILMIEGSLLFAAASVKKLESGDNGGLAYPFCARQAGVGYASAAGGDEKDARCEMWMPLWGKLTTYSELRAIFGEGRAHVRGRAARTGLDFVQAAVTLGVDRGITAFYRYGFQVRNGLAYFATPLDRVGVQRNVRADLLADMERWHDRLRQKAGPRANPEPPAQVAQALEQLESRIFELCRDDSPAGLLPLLAALGSVEGTLARSMKWTKENYIQPLSGLRDEWLAKANDNSPEFRLAQSISGMRGFLGDTTLWFRQNLEPVEQGFTKDRSWVRWLEQPSNDVAWHNGDLIDALNAILTRRLQRVQQSGVRGWPDWSPRPALLSDITDFIEGRTNDALLGDLIWGLSLVDWPNVAEERRTQGRDNVIPSSFYALLRLCFRGKTGGEESAIPVVPAILHRAINGQGREASILAARRLRASERAPLVAELPIEGKIARRTAAAILFPIAPCDYRLLEQKILKLENE